MKLRIAALFGSLCAASCTCESVKSNDIKTSGLYALLEANAPGTGRVNVKATLTLGQGSLTSLELASGDALTATVGPTVRAMSRTAAFGATWYEAGFDADAADTTVKIALSRQADTSAPESVVTLPPPFAFTSPSANAAFPRTGVITLSWSGAGQGDAMHVSARGACITAVDTDLSADSGAHTLAPFVAASGTPSDSCDVAIALVRTRLGQVDPAYGKGGAFKATVQRSITVRSTP